MTDTVGKIEQLTNENILNPKLMAPRCSALWEWYKTLAPRIREAMAHDLCAVDEIIEEIEAHSVEIEYQCRI